MIQQVFENVTLVKLSAVSDAIVKLCDTNTVFCFYGNLGTGKTTLIKDICLKLNVTDLVSSPTYPIINEYYSPEGMIYHIDLYRLTSINEALNIGLEDYLFSGRPCFIEWPDHFEPILPEEHIKIKITKFDEHRLIVLSTT